MLRSGILGLVVILLAGSMVLGQGQNAGDISCAFWLQWAERSKKLKESVAIPSTLEEMQRLVNDLVLVGEARGFRSGYAVGVMATTTTGRRSHLKDSSELVTALDTLCAAAPHKRLVDVAMHALGRR